jgi:NAD(P)-dependent dehydrogenase (short-subunit alcohol dehydrogenase family)
MITRFDNTIAYVNASAGTGIGSAVVRSLLTEGAIVVATDVSESRTARLAAELVDAFGADRILTRVVDATNELAVVTIFNEIRQRFGRLDVLVNSVGLNRLEHLAEMSLDTWMTVVNTCPDLTLPAHPPGMAAARRLRRGVSRQYLVAGRPEPIGFR